MAPATVHVLGEGGGIFEMSLPLPEAIAEQITKGVSRLVNADGTPVTETEARVAPEPKAVKAEWVGWAVYVSNGTLSVDDAEAMTKQDLVDKYAEAEPPAVGDLASVNADGTPVTETEARFTDRDPHPTGNTERDDQPPGPETA